MKKVKGLRSTNQSLPNSHGDAEVHHREFSQCYGARWVLATLKKHFVRYMIV